MRASSTLPLFAALLLFACNSEAETTPPPKKVDKGVDTKRIPVPNHGPDVMAGTVDKAVKVSATGKLEAQFNDKIRHFDFFGPGANAAVFAEDTGVARVMVSAAEGDRGFPRVDIRIGNVRLDKLEFPVTFPVDKKSRKKLGDAVLDGKEPELTIRFYRDEGRWWELAPGDTKAGKNKVTLDSYEGKKLTGTLQAKLVPRTEGMGEVIEIAKGTFNVELRLNGVKPGGADDAKADDAKADDAKADAKAAPGG